RHRIRHDLPPERVLVKPLGALDVVGGDLEMHDGIGHESSLVKNVVRAVSRKRESLCRGSDRIYRVMGRPALAAWGWRAPAVAGDVESVTHDQVVTVLQRCVATSLPP